VRISDVYPAFNIPESCRPVRLAHEAAARRGITPIVAATGGGSDANFFNGHGIDTVILSTGYRNPHCTDEVLDEAQFIKLAEWLYEIVLVAGRT